MYSPKTLQVWRAFLNWLGFLFQIFLQIIKDFGHLPLLSSSSSSPAFKPLTIVDLSDLDSSTSSTVPIDAGRDSACEQCAERLTVVLDLDETVVCAYEASSLPIAIKKTQQRKLG